VLVKEYFHGENALARRIEAAGARIGWTVDILKIHRLNKPTRRDYDFVINLVPGTYNRNPYKNYLAIFDPSHHYFHPNGSLKQEYLGYDGYLLAYSPDSAAPEFAHQLQPWIEWYPTVETPSSDQPATPSALFHICSLWGSRYHDPRIQLLLKQLDQMEDVHFYGDEKLQKSYPHAYRSFIPYDQVVDSVRRDGIALILHDASHNQRGIPSGRIFEATAASAIVISDQNPFVRRHFGDAVLYIDTQLPGEEIARQVANWMEWIKQHPEEAAAKAEAAHRIYQENFLLERQLLRLESLYHSQI
jgi:hypothetical protein